MKGILVLGLIATLAVTPGGSLDCAQCSSFDYSCDGSVVSECPADANVSCVASYASWPADLPPTSFQELACSPINLSLLPTTRSEVIIPLNVRVADGKTAWLRVQFCNGEPCNITSSPPTTEYPTEGTGDTQCPSCIGVNDTSCEESYVRCNPCERCVDVLAEVVQGTTVLFTLRVKGCSDICDVVCQLLSTPNAKIGNIVFRQLTCSEAEPIPDSLISGAALAAAP